MTNKIVAVQGNHPSKLNPTTDTSVFLANEIQSKKYKIFYYDPKNLSVINSKVIAKGFFIKFDYTKKKFFKIHIDVFERKRMKPSGFFATEILTSHNIIINQNIKLNKITYIDRDNLGFIISIKKVDNN